MATGDGLALDGDAGRADEANRRIYQEIALRSCGSVDDVDGLVLVTGCHPSPIIANVAFRRIDRPPVRLPPPVLLDGIVHHFESVGHGASLITSERRDQDVDAAAEAAGWVPAIDLPVKFTDARSMPDPAARDPTSRGWTRSETLDRSSTSWFPASPRATTSGGCSELSSRRPRASLVRVSAPFSRPRGGTFTGAGALYRFDDVAVVGFITVIESHRNRGLGTGITAALTNAAFEDGATLAALQASPMGYPVYRRMGFKTAGRDQIWIPPASG